MGFLVWGAPFAKINNNSRELVQLFLCLYSNMGKAPLTCCFIIKNVFELFFHKKQSQAVYIAKEMNWFSFPAGKETEGRGQNGPWTKSKEEHHFDKSI